MDTPANKFIESKFVKSTNELEKTFYRAIDLAKARQHEFATLEHLFLALLDDKDASKVLIGCGASIDELREKARTYVDANLDSLKLNDNDFKESGTKPTAGFQRAFHRAIIHVQSSGREEVTGANVLVALFSERESNAVLFLNEQDITRYDAVNYIVHGFGRGVAKTQPHAEKSRTPAARTIPAPIKKKVKYTVQELTSRQLLGLGHKSVDKYLPPRERLMHMRYKRALKGLKK